MERRHFRGIRGLPGKNASCFRTAEDFTDGRMVMMGLLTVVTMAWPLSQSVAQPSVGLDEEVYFDGGPQRTYGGGRFDPPAIDAMKPDASGLVERRGAPARRPSDAERGEFTKTDGPAAEEGKLAEGGDNIPSEWDREGIEQRF